MKPTNVFQLLPSLTFLFAASVQADYELVKGRGGYPLGWIPSGLNRSSSNMHSYDLEPTYLLREKWMSGLPDERPLDSLSIPGTHDSLSVLVSLPTWRRAQNWELFQQLYAGIRYLDIVLREKNRLLYISDVRYDGYPSMPYEVEYKMLLSHWPRYNYTEDSCAEKLAGWLQQNPREVIIARIRRDPRDTLNKTVSERSFAEAFGLHLRALKLDPFQRLERFFYRPPNGEQRIPKLGQVRGKVVMLLDFEGAEKYSDRGILFNSMSVRTDKYRSDLPVRTASDMDVKWTDINRHINRANDSANGSLYITNAAGGGIRQYAPEVVAAGGNYGRAMMDIRMNPETREDPLWLADSVILKNMKHRNFMSKVKDNTVLVGMNERLLHKLKDWGKNPAGRKTGIIVMDFPGKGLVTAIIKLNG